MAVRAVEKDVNFQGFSSDQKPAGPNGATFHVLDTGEEFVCHEGMWIADLRRIRALKPML